MIAPHVRMEKKNWIEHLLVYENVRTPHGVFCRDYCFFTKSMQIDAISLRTHWHRSTYSKKQQSLICFFESERTHKERKTRSVLSSISGIIGPITIDRFVGLLLSWIRIQNWCWYPSFFWRFNTIKYSYQPPITHRKWKGNTQIESKIAASILSFVICIVCLQFGFWTDFEKNTNNKKWNRWNVPDLIYFSNLCKSIIFKWWRNFHLTEAQMDFHSFFSPTWVGNSVNGPSK